MIIPEDQVLLEKLFDANKSITGWVDFCQSFYEHFNLRSVHLYLLNTQTYANRFQETAGKMPTEQDYKRYAETYIHHDPFQDFFISSPPGQFYASNLVPIDQEIRNSRMAIEWAVPQGLEYGCAAIIYLEKEWACVLHTTRNIEQPAYSEEEVGRMNAFIPYLEKAIRQRIQIAELTPINKHHLTATLNALKFPSILFNEFGEVVSLNQKMSQFLDSQSQLKVIDNHVSLNNPEDSESLSLAITQTTSLAKGLDLDYANDPIPLEHNSDISINFCEILEQGEQGDFFVGALLYIFDKNQINSPEIENLKSIFGFTQAEAQVAKLICEGLPPGSIANELKKSVETVREQLSTCYQKTKTKGQVELINLLMSLPSS